MSGWNGSGGFNRVYSWVADKAAAIDITASRMDTDTDNITANGFGNTLTRDGQGSATANLPMNGFRHTGAGYGVNPGDYATIDQLAADNIPISVSTLTVSGTSTLTGAVTMGAGAAITGATTFVSGGVVVTEGGQTITAGGLVVTAGGISVAANGATIAGGGTISGGVAITGGGTISGATTISTGGLVVGASGAAITGNSTITGTATVTQPGTSGSQAVNFSQFPATLGATGTETLPSGRVMKWGTGTISSGSGSVSFGTAFPTSCDNVQVTYIGATTPSNQYVPGVGTITASGFAVYGGVGVTAGYNWLAIGH